MKQCQTKYCRNRVKSVLVCSSCRSKKWREKNPMRYSYYNLRSSARKRGKDFELTFEEFEEFCYKTDYLKGKGRSIVSFSIDRIDNDKGYTKDNIQILSGLENRRKGVKKVLRYDYQNPEQTHVHTIKPIEFEITEEHPF